METASRQLLTKFETARALFDRAPLAGVEAGVASALAGELLALEVRFALSTGHLYIDATAGESKRLTATFEFARILAAEGFSGAVDGLVGRGEEALRDAGVALREDTTDAGRRGGRRGGRGGAPRGGALGGRGPAGAEPPE
jgi:hypothetical protein